MLDGVLPDPGSNGGFGRRVSISGDWALVGGVKFTTTAAFFERTGSGWATRTVTRGHSVVSLHGDRAVLGTGNGSTWVDVYERSGSTWNLAATVFSLNVDNHDDYGHAVALDGDTYVVSAPDWGLGFGMIEVRDLVGGSWQPRYLLTAWQNPAVINLGDEVALDGRWVVSTGSRPVIFDLGPSTYGKTVLNPGQEKITAVAVSGDTVALGAPLAGGPGGIIGKVFLFDHDGSSWIRGPELQPAGLASGVGFGHDVELDGDRLLVGASETKNRIFFIFERVGETWIEVGRYSESGAAALKLGGDLSLDGTRALASAIGEARVYDLFPAFPPSSYCVAGTTASGCQALVSGVGTPSASAASGFTIAVNGSEGQKDGTIYFGTLGDQSNAWGNGSSLQCVMPPVTRTGVLSGSGTLGSCDGSFALDFNAWMQAHSGRVPAAGSTVYAQTWFRDPQNTSNQSTSLSDALVFTVCP